VKSRCSFIETGDVGIDGLFDLCVVCAVDVCLQLALEEHNEAWLARGVELVCILLGQEGRVDLNFGYRIFNCIAYREEFKTFVSLFIVEPDGLIVLHHHLARPAPAQMNVDHYYICLKFRNLSLPTSFLFSGEMISRNCSVEVIAEITSFCCLGGIFFNDI
jgi:hypothetical protein